MDESMETLVEPNMNDESSNLNIQKLGCDDVLGTGGLENRWPGWPGDNVFRLLVPSQKVGCVIGRNGEIITKICMESKSRINIIDGPPGSPESVVIISAKEDPDVSISPAMDGLLRVHELIVNGLNGEGDHAPPNGRYFSTTRLLVPVTQARSLILKPEDTMKLFQEASNSVIRVVEKLPPIALQVDKVVEILAVPAAMHKALELVANHLRKFLVDRSVLPLFEMNMIMQQSQMGQHIRKPHMQQHMYPHMEQHMHHANKVQRIPPSQSWGPDEYPYMEQHMHHAYLGQHMPPTQPGGSHVPPPNAYGSCNGPDPQLYFSPPPNCRVEKPTQRRIFLHGRVDSPMSTHPSMNQPPQMSSQVTHRMQVPISNAYVVIGLSGANISYIRQTSGATISIQESLASGEITVEIIGSATQVHTAQQLILNTIARASVPSPTSRAAQNQIPPADRGHNSVPSPNSGAIQNQIPPADHGYN